MNRKYVHNLNVPRSSIYKSVTVSVAPYKDAIM